MITPFPQARTNFMKYLPLSVASLVLMALTPVVAQNAPSVAETAPPPSPTPSNQPSGLLTPPPDNAPATPPAPAAAATTTTTTSAASPSAEPSSTPHSSAEISRLRQQEIIRRQELIFRGDESLKAARKNELAQNYPEARKDYLFSVQAYGTTSRSTDSYATAAQGLERVDIQLYTDACRVGDTARAKMLVDEMVQYNPNDKVAIDMQAKVNRALANPNDTSILGNPAVTPGFVKKVDEVQQLFAEAEQFRRTGQWDEAEARLKRILGMDPYNIAATKQLERIDQEKIKYDDVSRDEMRAERLRQVEEKWYQPIENKDVSTVAQAGQEPLEAHTNFNIDQKLHDIFVSLDFNNATIEEATNFLSIESKRLDPDKKGVNFIIQPEASSSAKPVSLTLNNVPLGEALRYVCQLANVKYKVQDYAISIIPFSERTDDLISRTFIVQPNFVAPPSATGTINSAADNALGGGRAIPAATTPTTPTDQTTDDTSTDTVRAALIAKGLTFPPGASAVYSSATGQLTVVNTADQMELLEELVNAGQAPTLMVRISTKFVEINQQDLNDLTINTGFNLFPTNGETPITAPFESPAVSTPGIATQLPGALGFTPDSIDQLIAPQATVLNELAIRALIDYQQLNVVIQALSQKKSFDDLSEPAVLTKSGEQGVLEAVRVFPYPISFDPPQIVTQTTTGTTITTNLEFSPPIVIATTPTDFKRRNVGVRLVVKPQVTADDKTVDLSLFPEVTDFEGFINYGSEIFVANPDGSQSLLSTNEINQPVFNTRRINTKVLIHDGSTVVLGGLIRDDVQNINDKVPGLGDLPLVGRLFQSKAVENIKRNLIIFVTANIYRNDGELLNPPEQTNTADILTGSAGFTPVAHP
jgi:general secretion pathway protein D